MKAGVILVGAALGLLLAGCSNDPNRELVERDLRLQEDKIYQLQFHIEDLVASLEACRRENDSLKRELSVDAGEDLPSPGTAVPRATPPRRSGPLIPRRSAPPELDLEEPLVEPGVEMPLEGASLELHDPAAPARGRPARQAQEKATADNTLVQAIALSKRLTGGYNADGRPGDEGVTVLVVPQDASGRLIKAPADVSVAVIDPALSGSEARVARWDFRTDEIVNQFQKTPLGQGIHLKLLWPGQPPQNAALRLYARYVTADGRKLEASQDIAVEPSGRRAQWTKAAIASQPPAKDDQPHSHSAASEEPPVISKEEAVRATRPPATARRPAWAPYR